MLLLYIFFQTRLIQITTTLTLLPPPNALQSRIAPPAASDLLSSVHSSQGKRTPLALILLENKQPRIR